MPDVKCKFCKKDFYTKPSQIKFGFGKYCSKKCQYQGRKTGRFINCFICGKESYKQLRHIKSCKSGKFFCSKSCQTIWRNTYFSGKNHPNWKEGKFQDYRDKFIRAGIKPVCKMCGIKDKRLLVVHHNDHNRQNNSIDNLTWLCLNCHYLVHSYKEQI